MMLKFFMFGLRFFDQKLLTVLHYAYAFLISDLLATDGTI